ncbi:hypothetical protein H0H93_010916 [Arthromyces matolae]|nr:hypothetical protein H0H93_010916 [Arthromyces matolae]
MAITAAYMMRYGTLTIPTIVPAKILPVTLHPVVNFFVRLSSSSLKLMFIPAVDCVLHMRVDEPQFYEEATNEFTALFRANEGYERAKSLATVWYYSQYKIKELMQGGPSRDRHAFSLCEACTWDAVIPLYLNWEPQRINQVAAAALVSRHPSLPSRIQENTEHIASDTQATLVSARLSYLLKDAEEGLPELYKKDKYNQGLDTKGLLHEVLAIQSRPLIKSCRGEAHATVANAHAWARGRAVIKTYLGLGTHELPLNIHSCHICSSYQESLTESVIPARHESATQHADSDSWLTRDDDYMTSLYFGFDSAPALRDKGLAAAVLVLSRKELPTQILDIKMDEKAPDMWTRQMMFLSRLHGLLEPLMEDQGLSRTYENGEVIGLLHEILKLASSPKQDALSHDHVGPFANTFVNSKLMVFIQVQQILHLFPAELTGSTPTLDLASSASSFTMDIDTPDGSVSGGSPTPTGGASRQSRVLSHRQRGRQGGRRRQPQQGSR